MDSRHHQDEISDFKAGYSHWGSGNYYMQGDLIVRSHCHKNLLGNHRLVDWTAVPDLGHSAWGSLPGLAHQALPHVMFCVAFHQDYGYL